MEIALNGVGSLFPSEIECWQCVFRGIMRGTAMSDNQRLGKGRHSEQ